MYNAGNFHARVGAQRQLTTAPFLMPKRTDIRKILIIGSGPIIAANTASFGLRAMA